MTGVGRLITLEGGEGAGKSTHIRVIEELLANGGVEVLRLREPGGTAVGEALRAVVLDPAHGSLSPEAELLIYEAARAQLVSEVIRPALERGAVVLCDRFTDSTLAYQGGARGIDSAFIAEANAFATQGLVPDRTLLFRCGGAGTGLARATAHSQADRLEQEGIGFHQLVDQAFLSMAKADPDRIRIIDSSGKHIETARTALRALSDLFPWLEAVAADDAALAAAIGHARESRRAAKPSGARGSGA